MSDNKDYLSRLNVGGEGEEECCVQINLPWVIEQGENFIASRNGEKIGVSGIKRAGPLVICDTEHFPFKDGAFDQVIANGVPINEETHLGPGYKFSELRRVCRKGLLGIKINGRVVGFEIHKEKSGVHSLNGQGALIPVLT